MVCKFLLLGFFMINLRLPYFIIFSLAACYSHCLLPMESSDQKPSLRCATELDRILSTLCDLLNHYVRSPDQEERNNLIQDIKVSIASFIDHGGNINLQDTRGRTLLHTLVEERLTDVASVFIGKGASYNIKDYAGNTPLSLAIAYGSNRDFQLLQQAIHNNIVVMRTVEGLIELSRCPIVPAVPAEGLVEISQSSIATTVAAEGLRELSQSPAAPTIVKKSKTRKQPSQAKHAKEYKKRSRS
jgi:hypothetical protein